MIPLPIIAVDIGNARIKLGFFRQRDGDGLPEPESVLTLEDRTPEWGRMRPWLEEVGHGQFHWWIGSVNRPATTRLLDWLRQHRPADAITLLAAGDLPLAVSLPRPDMVGIDRLLDAAAANHLRRPGCPAVVVDLGSAITVDLVSEEGAFLGGSILPGMAMSARALHEFTDLLPLVDLAELSEPPPALGDATVPALQSGLFYGAVGGIRQLIELFAKQLQAEPQVFLTGGAGPAVAAALGAGSRHVPHLTLAGIALAAE